MKISRTIRKKKAALLAAAMMLPLVVGFTVEENSSAEGGETKVVDKAFEETSQENSAEKNSSLETNSTDKNSAEKISLTQKSDETNSAENISLNEKNSDKNSAEKKSAESSSENNSSEENSSEETSVSETEEESERKSQIDTIVEEYMKKFEGKTIVDIEYEGAGEATLPTVKAAMLEHVGDAFSTQAAMRDRDAIIRTGYFYDAYQTFQEVPEGVVITYHMLENPVLTEIIFTGNTVFDTEDLEKLMTVKQGEILNSTTLHDNVAAIQEKYRGDGYILMKMTDLNIDKDGILTLKINEGVLEGYKVKGNKKTKDKVILREMRQKEGEPFNAKKARRSMQRVYNLGFFEDVNVKMNPGIEPNAVVMEIDVKEKRTGVFGLGAGYSTKEGILGMVSIADTNFRGTGDSVSVTYERSGDDEDAQGFTFAYRHPWMDHHETAGTIKIYNRTYEYDDYDTRGHLKEEYMRKYSGGEITISRPVSEYSTNYLTIRHRKDKYVKHVSSGNAGDRSGLAGREWRHKNFGVTRSITLEHVTDTRDNIYNPTTGGRVNLSIEVGGLIGGDFDFQKYSIEHQQYFKAGNHSQVWALRGKYGVGHGDMTEFNQFRVGGQDSLRGYRDDQFRGDRMATATLEYRFPLAKKVQGAIFTDWGSAWDTGFWPDNFNGSIGVGLSLNTPLGPLRLDYGYGKQHGRVHFSVGGSF